MLKWMCQNMLDEAIADIAAALRDELEHSTSCPMRYSTSHPSVCVCHVDKTVRLVEDWGREQ